MRLVLLALLLAPAAALAQMYKCVDEHGVTSYSDKPCAGGKGGQVDIHGSPPISGALQPRSEDLSREEADFRRRQIARDREVEKDAKDRMAAQRRCAALRNEKEGLSRARRVVVLDGKGGRSYMDDQTRDKRLAELNAQLSRCP